MNTPPTKANGTSCQSADEKVQTYKAQIPPTDAMFAEGQMFHLKQRFAEAESIYRRITEIDPKHVGAWQLIGLVSTAQDKWAEAIDGFEHVLTLVPDHVEALTQLGIVFARLQRLTEAIQKLRR